ncbi:hypothetical protein BDF22DRAFT_661692 [Syncephalis plumigaleata]|nr:hypothetical protein BDF22DRAFT_661692 [Syncephalis plumigaleata]
MDHIRAIQQKYNDFLSRFPLQKHAAHHRAEGIVTPVLFTYGTSQSTETPSFDVKCLQWQAYLKMRHVDFEVYCCNEGNASSNDRLPFLALPGGKYLTGDEIREYADNAGKPSDEASEGKDDKKDNTLIADEQALLSLIERKLYPALLYWMWCEQDNYHSSTCSIYLAAQSCVPWTLQRNVSNWIYDRYRGNLTYERIYTDATEALLALSNRLGQEAWLLNTSEPSFIDAVCFAYLHVILSTTSMPEGKLRSLARQHENLVTYEQRIFTTMFK